MLLRRISSFLKNVKIPYENERRGGICTHCKNINTTSNCERCSYLVSTIKKEKESIEGIQKLKDTLSEIKLFLETVISGTLESLPNPVEKLLKEFKSMKIIPTKDEGVQKLFDINSSEYKKELKELKALKVKEANGSQFSASTKNMDLNLDKGNDCICKLLAKNVYEHSPLSFTEENPSRYKTMPQETVVDIKRSEKCLNNKILPHQEAMKIYRKPVKVCGGGKVTGKKSGKVQTDKSSELFMKMILKKQKSRKRGSTCNLKEMDLIRLDRCSKVQLDKLLPLPKKGVKQFLSDESVSVVKCEEIEFLQTSEVIKENEIVTYEQYQKKLRHVSTYTPKPLRFTVEHDFSYPTLDFLEDIREKKIGHKITTEV